jgi:CBS domain-containing protein
MSTVQDLLRHKGRTVYTVAPTDSVLVAADLMNQHSVGGLVVVDGQGQVVGMFTERDILRRVLARRRDPDATLVAEVMTTGVLACRPETTLEECASVMTTKRIRHLPVRDDLGLVGIVTIGDLLAAQVDEQLATIQYLTSFVFDNR